MPAKVILNPYAGRWKALRMREQLEIELQKAGIIYELVQTEAPRHGTELAAQATLDGFSPIISAGGDGSISEVVNGIARASQQSGKPPPPFGVLPLGTANDLMVNLKLPLDLAQSVQVIAKGYTRPIDLGQVTAWDADGTVSQTRYFDNNSAIGLEPSVTLIQQEIKWIRGILRYLFATLVAIIRNPQWTMHLQWSGGEYHGPSTLVTAGNNPLTGGLFYMAPHADPFDGLLSIVYGSMPTRRKILQLLPRTMKPGLGNYVEHPDIHEVNVDWLTITTDQPTPVHADGEIMFERSKRIEYRVLPGFLPILIDDRSNISS
jgi:diacylglycerol kinase (ATP)